MANRELKRTGREPNTWEVKHFANIGTSEEFVQQLMLEIPELLEAGTIFDPQRTEVREAILTISMEGLMQAFEQMKRIRASVDQSMPELNRKQLYEDFTRALWHAYKDLLPKAALAIGYDIGFLFQNDTNFEKGVSAFRAQYKEIPSEFTNHLRKQRESWQNELGRFRNNFLEHRKEDPELFKAHYEPAHAEATFDAVWRICADVLAVFLACKMPPGFSICEIPQAERNPARPRRFMYIPMGASASSK